MILNWISFFSLLLFIDSASVQEQDGFQVSRHVDQPQTDKEYSGAIAVVDKMCEKYKKSQYIIEKIPAAILGQKPAYAKRADCAQINYLSYLKHNIPKEFPHMAFIGYEEGSKIAWACGGTLISEQYILSAAHCATGGVYRLPKLVRLGELDEDFDSHEVTQILEIVKIFIHPNYKDGSVYDDIALFKLNETVKFSGYIRPICLHTSHTIKATFATATGWGTIGYGYSPNERLWKLNISLVEEQKCKQLLGENLQIPNGIDGNKMICVSENYEVKEACQSDSGGPLTFKNPLEPCMHIQIGIASFGNQFCGQPNSPGVYTRVSNYIPWIVSIVWNNTTVK